MRKFSSKGLYLLILLINTACLEEVDPEQEQFVKILGSEGSSIAHNVKELSNGDLLIFGEYGVAASDISDSPNGPEFNEVEDQAPFIAITDRNGNLKTQRSYPIEDLQLTGVDIINPANKTTIWNVIELENGGFILQARIGPVSVIGPPLIAEPEDNATTPILILLDPELRIIKKYVVTAGSDWDFIYRTEGILKEMPDGNFGLLCGYLDFNIGDAFSNSEGYSFLQFDKNLELLNKRDFNYIGIKGAHDFVIDQNNNLVVLGQQDANAYLFKTPLDSLTQSFERSTKIYDQIFGSGRNDNEHFISLSPNGGYSVAFTDSPSKIVYQKLDENGSVLSESQLGPFSKFGGNIRSPRSQFRARNGDMLYYTIFIPETDDRVSSILYRVSDEGSIIFEKAFDGTPGGVTETAEGAIIVVSNILYNKTLPKVNIFKLNADGELL